MCKLLSSSHALLPSIFINKVLLRHNPACPFIYYLWLFLCYNCIVSSCNKDHMSKACNNYYVTFYRKQLATHWPKCVVWIQRTVHILQEAKTACLTWTNITKCLQNKWFLFYISKKIRIIVWWYLSTMDIQRTLDSSEYHISIELLTY